jgi:addiction module HigA family antidote
MEERATMHPGEILLEAYMKPRGVTQYRLAQAIGVPQIRVSEIVRGKRAISADTAMRLARFFEDTTADFWMDRQRKYDLATEKVRLGEDLERVRPQTVVRGTMRAGRALSLRTLVDATDLVGWADRREAQGQLPRVVRDLVLATVGRAERVVFSADEGVQLPGWDGIVEASQGNAFVPDGLSAWEVGTDKDVRRKANRDYAKRTKNPLGLDPSETTFVFVTPRYWSKKREWAAEKQAEGVWREVRVYDAEDLETWLEFAPGVHVRLSTLTGKHPEGADALRTFWEGWAGVTEVPMSAELVISGRNEEAERVLQWLRGRPSSLALRAESKEEAIAFLAAAMYRMPATEREAYFARSIVVEDGDAWRQLSGFGEGLVLVPRFDVRDAGVVLGGHHVLIPLGRGEGTRSTALVELPRPRREDAKGALLEMGYAEKKVEDLATLARRSPLALRRKLAVHQYVKRPRWAESAEARSLLPAMLIGAWEGTNAGDREVVAKLAGRPYGEFEDYLVRWANESDPPVRRVGNTWLIASKEDAWTLLAEFITRDDLDAFEEVVLGVLGEVDPSFDMPEDRRWAAGVYGKSLPHSGLLREGLAETLALMGARSETTSFSTTNSGQERANTVVRKLLDRANEDWRLWASLSGVLPLLAEAAPGGFLEAAEKGASGEEPVLVELFSEPGPLGSSPHTGLLWALETLAWDPDHLGYAARLLARLAALDPYPDSRFMSRPLRSLKEIFQVWYPHTKAGPEKRMRVIDAVRHREPEVAWRLLCGMLPEMTGGVSMPTHSPRWRDWAPEEPPRVTYGEIWAGTREVIERLLEDVGTDGGRWRDLVEKVDDLPKEQHDAVVERLLEVDVESFVPEDRLAVRDALREMISRHRQFPDTDWAMPGEWVNKLQRAYECFEADDPVSRHAWLFSHHPDLLEPSGREWLVKQGDVEAARLQAAQEVYATGGYELLLDLAASAEVPGELGVTLGKSELLTAVEEDDLLREGLGSAEGPRGCLARGFVVGRFRERGWPWVEAKLPNVSEWSSEQKATFFTSLPFGGRTWDQLEAMDDEETQRLYWSRISVYGLSNAADCARAVDRFITHGRPHAAVHLISLRLGNEEAAIPPSMMADALERTVRSDPEEYVDWSLFSHRISKVLDALEASGEIEDERIAALEWYFLPLFGHHGRPPRVLHRELSRNPDFFAEIISLVFKAEDEEQRELSEEEQTRARFAYELLDSWQSVPGLKEDGSVDPDALRTWVDKAREATHAAGRGTVADVRIGQVLASSPKGSDDAWPDVAVRDLIDDLGEEDIESGFEIGVYNSRGVFSRSLTEGGEQERQLAERYKGYADVLNDQWPRTAAMLRRIADVYVSEARREDVEAELREDFWR